MGKIKKQEELEIPDFLKYKYRHIRDGWQDDKIELPDDKIFNKVVAIMRANPPHINHTLMLKELCKKAVNVKINLGSSNKFNEKNPFKIEEREEMMDLSLNGEYDNYEILRIPDFGDDDEWFKYLYKINKPFSEILSNNQYDLKIYKRFQKNPGYDNFDIIHPTDILSQEDMVYTTGIWKDGMFVQARKPMYVSGTFTRAAIVNDWNWEKFIDEKVVKYIKKNGLVARIKNFCSDLEGITLQDLEEDR